MVLKVSELIAELNDLKAKQGDALVKFEGKWAKVEADPWTEWVDGWEKEVKVEVKAKEVEPPAPPVAASKAHEDVSKAKHK